MKVGDKKSENQIEMLGGSHYSECDGKFTFVHIRCGKIVFKLLDKKALIWEIESMERPDPYDP